MENKELNTKEVQLSNHIQIKRGNSSPEPFKDFFKIGELGYDLTNNDLYIKTDTEMVRIGSNIVDTADTNSQALITSHGVALIKKNVDDNIKNVENNIQNMKDTTLSDFEKRIKALEDFKNLVVNGDSTILVEP